MPLPALGLLLVAAVLHTGWNLLLKQAGERYISLWWALVVGAVLFSPALFFSPALPARVWPYALTGAVFEAAYFGLLASAYKRGDFSLVYPIARGTAPAFLALWSVLWLNEVLNGLGLLGLGVSVVGLIIVGGSAVWGQGRATASTPSLTSLLLALAVALFISLYSVVDGAAVQFAAPAPYTVLAFGLTALLLLPILLRRYGWAQMVAVGRIHWRRITLIGGLMLVTYLLVLIAYSLAPVGYSGAVREVSIVFAALAGWLWLGEGLGALRVVGALVIVGGIVLIALGG